VRDRSVGQRASVLVRREAKRHAALDFANKTHPGSGLPEPFAGNPKRRRRCALPAQSKGARVCDVCDPQPLCRSPSVLTDPACRLLSTCCGSQPRSGQTRPQKKERGPATRCSFARRQSFERPNTCAAADVLRLTEPRSVMSSRPAFWCRGPPTLSMGARSRNSYGSWRAPFFFSHALGP
jgi:hypothetical protein